MTTKGKVVPIKGRKATAPGETFGIRTGKVVGTTASGKFLVEYRGHEPMAARTTSSAKEELRRVSAIGCEVVLTFEDGDPRFPVIISTLPPREEEPAGAQDVILKRQGEMELETDLRSIVLNAEEEVVLRCGEASITLTKAGKVIIRGSYVVSRSTGTNSIKGSSIRIN